MSDQDVPVDTQFSFRGVDRDSEALQRCLRLVDSVDGLYHLDSAGRFVAVNDVIVDVTGYSRADLLEEHVSIVIDDTDVQRIEQEIRQCLETGADPTTRYDLEIETAASERIPCELRFDVVVEDDTFEGTVGVVRRVDDHDQPGGQLPSAFGPDESILSVVDDADVGVFILDESFDIAWIDETAATYFGLDRHEVIGRNKRTLINETIAERLSDPDTFAETVVATYDDNTYVEQFECEITPGDGREGRILEHRSNPIEIGRWAGGRVELYYDVTDRTVAQRDRQENEKRYRMLVDAVEEYAIFMLDSDGTVVSWNEGAERIKGYRPSEILGEHVSVFYTDEDRAAGVPEHDLVQARETGSVEDEGWRVRADGSRFWATVSITAVYEGDTLRGYAKVTRDMTDRRDRERQLRNEYELTEQILETSPVGIAVVNPDGTIARANERMAQLLDLQENEQVYTTAQREMYDSNGDLIPVERRPVARVFDTGEPVTDQEVLVDVGDSRQWLSINARPITDDRGVTEQVVEIATDISNLKELAERRKRSLEEREKELAAVRLVTKLLETDEQPVGDLLQEFVDMLPQFFKYSDYTAARVSVGTAIAATDAYESHDQQLTAATSTVNGTPITLTVVLVDGEVSERGTGPFLEEERELLDTLATLLKLYFDRRDYISDLQESNERLEQFAYAASHDLQEPLRMVSSYLQLIESRYADELDDDGEDFLEFAIDGAERMREMIDGLLEYSRVETQGEPFERVDLDDVLTDVLADLQLQIEESDAEITAESLPPVEGDASQLRQVFQNLLDNAIEYSGDEPPRVHVTAERAEDEWIVSVTDEGIGIDPDDADRVFEVFQRLHTNEEHSGTGLGLALCERIVERHGGDIWLEPAPDEGTTVVFTLPVAEV